MHGHRVAILAGGFSPEREVSLSSGANVAAHLRRAGYTARLIDISAGILDEALEAQYLKGGIRDAPSESELAGLRARTDLLEVVKKLQREADIAFPVVHGTLGEDGKLQAVLDTAGVPYAGSDALGQLLALNKDVAKHLFVCHDVPTPAWTRITRQTSARERVPRYPLVVKPASAGSSLGVSFCSSDQERDDAIARAFRYDDELVLEEFIEGREFTVGVLGERVLAVGEIRSTVPMFDYHAKYQAASTREIFPADLPEPVIARVRHIAGAAVSALRLRHYCRIDFMIDRQNRVFVLEVNGLPGLTAKSLFPQSASAAGLPFEVVCDELCRMALARRDSRS